MGFDRRNAFAIAIFALALASVSAAAADPPRLKGRYGFTGTGECLIAPGHVGALEGPPLPNPTPGVALPNSGFNPRLQPNDAGPGSSTQAYARPFASEGIRTFNGDGTGTVRGTTVAFNVRPTPGPGGFPAFAPAASSSDFSFAFTYTVNSDGSWTTAMVPGTYTETFLTGPSAGQTGTVDAIPPFTGLISHDGKTLIAAQVTTAVETHTLDGAVSPMICIRSRVFIKLDDADHD